jgi:inosose dehydratase
VESADMTWDIGNAPVSYGVQNADDPGIEPWENVAASISECGYKAMELGPVGYFSFDADYLNIKADSLGLKITAGTLMRDLAKGGCNGIINEAERLCRLCKDVRAKYLVIIDGLTPYRNQFAGRPEMALSYSEAEFNSMVEILKDLSDIALEYELIPVLHPHAGTQIEYEYEFEMFLDHKKLKNLNLVLDTGHLTYCEIDPSKIAKKFADRIAYVHLKDVDVSELKRFKNNHGSFSESIRNAIFTPLGQGSVDFRSLKETLSAINYRGIITVEQDTDVTDLKTCASIAAKNLIFLKKLGFSNDSMKETK